MKVTLAGLFVFAIAGFLSAAQANPIEDAINKFNGCDRPANDVKYTNKCTPAGDWRPEVKQAFAAGLKRTLIEGNHDLFAPPSPCEATGVGKNTPLLSCGWLGGSDYNLANFSTRYISQEIVKRHLQICIRSPGGYVGVALQRISRDATYGELVAAVNALGQADCRD